MHLAILLSRLVRPAVIFWLALAILLPVHLLNVIQDGWLKMPPKPVGDGLEYENIAYHLWKGEGYAIRNKDPGWSAVYQGFGEMYRSHLEAPARDMHTTGRPPGYPTVIAGIYGLLGRNPNAFGAIRLFAASCLALASALAAFLTARLFAYRGAAVSDLRWNLNALLAIAGTIAFAVGQRTLKSYALDFLTEPMALLLMQLFVNLAIESQVWADSSHDKKLGKRPSWPWAISCGILLGALMLTRSVYVVWLPGLWLLWSIASRKRFTEAGLSASLMIMMALLCCLPWWTRNVHVLDRWMPLGTQGPITLLGGYSDEALAAGGEWQPQPEQRLRAELRQQDAFAALESDMEREVYLSKVAKSIVMTWVGTHVGDLPEMFLSRMVIHWNPYFGLSLIWKLFVLCGMVRIVSWAWHPRLTDYAQRADAIRIVSCWLIGLPLLSTIVASMLYTVGGRFLVPLYGVLFLLGGIGLAAVMDFVLRRTGRVLRLFS